MLPNSEMTMDFGTPSSELPPFCSTGNVLKAVELVAINTGGSGPTCDESSFLKHRLSHYDVLLCNWDGSYSLANDDKEEVNDPDSEKEDYVVQKVNGF